MGKRSQLLSLLGVAVISGAIFYLVQGVQKEQTIKTQASSSVAKVYISPEEQTLPPAATFNLFADLPIAAKEMTLHIKFDNTLLQILKKPEAIGNFDLISATALEEANSTGEVEIELSSDSSYEAGVHQLVEFEFDALEDQVLQTTIHLSADETILVGFEGQLIPEEVEHASVSIRPQD